MSSKFKFERYNVTTDMHGISVLMEAVRFGDEAWNVIATLQIGEVQLTKMKHQTISTRIWDALREAEDEVISYLIYRTDVHWS